jgi:hypothetical protein
MSKLTECYDRKELLGLLTHIQNCAQSQSAFLEHLSIDDFHTNKRLFRHIRDFNSEILNTLDILIANRQAVIRDTD